MIPKLQIYRDQTGTWPHPGGKPTSKTDLTSIWVGEFFKSLGLVCPWTKSFTLIFVGEMDVDDIRWWWIFFLISSLAAEMIQVDEYIFRMNGNHPKKPWQTAGLNPSKYGLKLKTTKNEGNVGSHSW